VARFVCALCFLVLCGLVSAGVVEENFDFRDISRQLSVYAPVDNTAVTTAAARALFSTDKVFTSHDDESLMLGGSENGYWIKGELPASSRLKTVILALRYFHLDDVELFLKQADGGISTKRFLRSSQSSLQLVDTNVAFVIPLASQVTPFLLYVRPQGVSYNVFNIHVVLQSMEHYDNGKMSKITFKGVLIGFIVSMLCYNLLLFLLVGYQPYLYYCGYLLSLFMMIYSAAGLAYIGPYPLSISSTLTMLAMAPTLAIICLLQFGRHILHLDQYTPRLDRIYRLVQWLWLLCLPITLLDWELINSLVLTAQIVSVFTMAVVSYSLHRRYRLTGALIFSLSFVFLVVGAGLHVCLEVLSFEYLYDSETFVAVYRWIESYMFDVTAMIEMMLLSAVLASFIRQAERDKITAQEEKYVLAQESLLLKEQYSDQLETEVRASTAELKQKNVELKGLQEVRDRFFGYITHEFRSPLTLILGPLTDMKGGRHGELAKPLIQAVNLAESNAQKMLGLVNHLLELARLRNSRMKLSVAEVDVVGSLERLVAPFSLLLSDKGITLSTENDVSDQAVIWFDQSYFDSIFSNLLSNACTRTPAKGSIVLGVRLDDAYLSVSVFNSGSYIPPDVQAHIFDPFYRQKSSGAVPENSSGVGLAQVKEYLDVHGGDITVHSAERHGTTFTVMLKRGKDFFQRDTTFSQHVDFIETESSSEACKEDASVFDGVNPRDQTETDDQDRTTILVVDDNQQLREYIADLLLEHDYQVLTADNGEQAYELCQSRFPDLLISDVVMPQTSGLELVALIRNNSELMHLPIILLTSEVDKSSQINGIEEGADDYLTKPFVPAELLARLRRTLEQRQLVRDKYFQEVFLEKYDNRNRSKQNIKSKSIRFIHEHLSDTDFGVERLAELLCMSRSTLNRHLKEGHQVTAVELILSTRMNMAVDLLTTDSRLIDIAYAVGFKSQSYFTRRFVEKYTVTPSQWRKNGGGHNSSSTRKEDVACS